MSVTVAFMLGQDLNRLFVGGVDDLRTALSISKATSEEKFR
jgi:hypothetical protein